MKPSGSITKIKQPMPSKKKSVEHNPDPIRDRKDLAEFEKLYQQEKTKLDKKK